MRRRSASEREVNRNSSGRCSRWDRLRATLVETAASLRTYRRQVRIRDALFETLTAAVLSCATNPNLATLAVCTSETSIAASRGPGYHPAVSDRTTA
jgi:hypothetical protein